MRADRKYFINETYGLYTILDIEEYSINDVFTVRCNKCGTVRELARNSFICLDKNKCICGNAQAKCKSKKEYAGRVMSPEALDIYRARQMYTQNVRRFLRDHPNSEYAEFEEVFAHFGGLPESTPYLNWSFVRKKATKVGGKETNDLPWTLENLKLAVSVKHAYIKKWSSWLGIETRKLRNTLNAEFRNHGAEGILRRTKAIEESGGDPVKLKGLVRKCSSWIKRTCQTESDLEDIACFVGRTYGCWVVDGITTYCGQRGFNVRCRRCGKFKVIRAARLLNPELRQRCMCSVRKKGIGAYRNTSTCMGTKSKRIANIWKGKSLDILRLTLGSYTYNSMYAEAIENYAEVSLIPHNKIIQLMETLW